jgi:hypothetical protein
VLLPRRARAARVLLGHCGHETALGRCGSRFPLLLGCCGHEAALSCCGSPCPQPSLLDPSRAAKPPIAATTRTTAIPIAINISYNNIRSTPR